MEKTVFIKQVPLFFSNDNFENIPGIYTHAVTSLKKLVTETPIGKLRSDTYLESEFKKLTDFIPKGFTLQEFRNLYSRCMLASMGSKYTKPQLSKSSGASTTSVFSPSDLEIIYKLLDD